MSYNEASNFSGPLGPMGSFGVNGRPEEWANNRNGYAKNKRTRDSEPSYFHGEALARDMWAERYGPWLVLGFAASFSLFLVLMTLLGQTPGKSFLLKGASDILQFVGEGLGLVFCARIAVRLHTVSTRLRHELLGKTNAERRSANELAAAHTEAQAAQRAFIAWAALAIGIALYASGQAVWTSYDIRMNSANVPFPGLYDIGFVLSYPFFLVGTLMLTRRGKASVGRTRLVLDALGVIGASLAISWFFLLSPLIATLAQQPSTGAAVLSVYFPTGDLFLVAVGAFLMFSPLANRAQQPVFMLLCMGLFFLAITDSLLSFYNLASGFNTGTVQDVLWPLSMALIGLAAIEYPRSVAREQEQDDRNKNAGVALANMLTPGRFAQFSSTAQTIAPFILVIGTCALLLTDVTTRGGTVLIQADLVALALILIVIARQALTLLENNRLTMQMRGELVISRRELQVTKREVNESNQTAQDQQIIEAGIATLREVHARVARGDIAARAPTVVGPLLPIAISLNLMLDRLSALSQRGARYDRLTQDCKMLQEGVERLGQGLVPWNGKQPAVKSVPELSSVFLSLAHIQRLQASQWHRMGSSVESMHNLTRRIYDALNEVKHSSIFHELAPMSLERMNIERIVREIDLLEQQQSTMLNQIIKINTPTERTLPQPEEHEVQNKRQESYAEQQRAMYDQEHNHGFNTANQYNQQAANQYNQQAVGQRANHYTPEPDQSMYNPYNQRMAQQQRIQRVPSGE